MAENKNEIVQDLCRLLQKTRYGDDITGMEYSEERYGEYVYVTYNNNCQRKVDISGDSGIAIIKDILKNI